MPMDRRLRAALGAPVGPAGMGFDPERFMRAFGERFGAPTERRAAAIRVLLAAIGRDPGFTVLRHVAYLLATIKWETRQTFEPVKERRARQGVSPQQDKVYAAQQRYWSSGFYGRGYVQITFQTNYQKAGSRLQGIVADVLANGAVTPLTIAPASFVEAPDLVLEPGIAYLIAARGMREGWFRSRRNGPPYRLEDFII